MIEPKISRSIISHIKDFLINNNISIYDETNGSGIFRNVMMRVSSAGDVMVVLVSTKKFNKLENLVSSLKRAFKEIKSIYLK